MAKQTKNTAEELIHVQS